MPQLRLDSMANNLSELQRLADSDSIQTYVAHMLEHQRHMITSRTQACLDGLPLRALHAILDYSTVLGRLAIFHTNRTLRAAVHANKDIFADLSFRNEFRGSLHPATLHYLLNYTDNPLKLTINLPLHSPVIQHADVLLLAQTHLARTRSLYISACWESIQVQNTRYRVNRDQGIEWRVGQMRATWRWICSFLEEPAPQLKRICVESGSSILSTESGPLTLSVDLFGGIAPLLQGLRLEDALLPVQPVLALSRIQDFSYVPQPSTLNAADLRNILQMMPELRALELYIMNFEPNTVDTPHTISSPAVPLRVFRLEHICNNLDKILLQIHAVAGSNLSTITLYDDGEDDGSNPLWLKSVLAVYQRILRIVMIKHGVEIDVATDDTPDHVVAIRLFISDDYSLPEDSVTLLRSGDRTVPGSLAWLTSLTMHEFLWPRNLTAGEMGGWYPRLPALTDVELVLGTLDDYARMYNGERVTVMLADSIMGGMSMPQMARLTLSHRVRGPHECNYAVTKCTCEQLLSVSLADLFDLTEALKPESTRLKVLILRGLDPVDLDLDVQLLRLGRLADEIQLVPLPDFKTIVWPGPRNYAWPEDPRGSFSVWSDSPAELREVSLLGL